MDQLASGEEGPLPSQARRVEEGLVKGACRERWRGQVVLWRGDQEMDPQPPPSGRAGSRSMEPHGHGSRWRGAESARAARGRSSAQRPLGSPSK